MKRGERPSKQAASKKDLWQELWEHISTSTEAAIADSWKGGGDPLDHDVIEARLQYERVALAAHIDKMRRELE